MRICLLHYSAKSNLRADLTVLTEEKGCVRRPLKCLTVPNALVNGVFFASGSKIKIEESENQ